MHQLIRVSQVQSTALTGVLLSSCLASWGLLRLRLERFNNPDLKFFWVHLGWSWSDFTHGDRFLSIVLDSSQAVLFHLFRHQKMPSEVLLHVGLWQWTWLGVDQRLEQANCEVGERAHRRFHVEFSSANWNHSKSIQHQLVQINRGSLSMGTPNAARPQA